MASRKVSLLLAIIALFATTVTAKAQGTDYFNPETWLLGYFNQDVLLKEPHAEWYDKGFDAYEFNSEDFMQLVELPLDGLSIRIVLGTWCPDSRREVPHFMKILQSWGFPSEKVEMIGVDSYKVAPIENYEELGIERVPTFIIYYNNVEAGRIIENPTTSLERDMVKIISEVLKK